MLMYNVAGAEAVPAERLPNLTSSNLSTTMNTLRLPIATLMLSLAIMSGCAEAKLLQQVETKPRPFKDLVPNEPPPTDPALIKPNPLTLEVDIDITGKVTLNRERAGTTDNTRPLLKRLKRIFAERERNRVYEPRGEEEMRIAKAVFVRAPSSARYVAVVRVIDAIRSAGGSPIGLHVDDSK
jgi:biopolymer transport protein ExbD